ncbi:cytochrome C oxidase subunit II [Brevibacillus fulvus]|uniref:Cytochrome c oxidase subunit 2A n=1 Tax=Brevibacillus fulvus TaxID=1125967 RepID=A0A939BQ93_9BACL|nr:cytochrome C oxidase subunit II [Brevibacillus fulvus]MBM7591375.1 hypothetical protein [Brevibacillus fulvus]
MKQSKKDGSNLKGTLVSVFALGLLIVASWLAMFALYWSRQ